MSRFVYNKNTKQATVTAGLTDADYLIPAINKSYKSDDTADTTIDSSDYIPFYDSSTNSTKKILVSNAHFGGGDAEINSISDEISTMNNILGAKNLLRNNASSQVINGITWTVNADGTVRAQGTASAVSALNITTTEEIPICDSYIISGCPTGGSHTTYLMGWAFISEQYGTDVTVNYSAQYHSQPVQLTVWPAAGEVDLLFKPMIRPASIADDTYVPYTMTNRELTTDVTEIKKALNESYIIDGATASSTSYATISGLNNKLKQIDDKTLFIVVGVAKVVYTICIFSGALGPNQTHEFRTGSERDTIKVTWTGSINGGTLQLTSCVIDGVEYNTNSETYIDIYD